MARSSRRRLLCCAFLAVIVFAAPILAQVTGPEAPHDSQQLDLKKSGGIRINVEMALVNVTVTDPYSRLVTGLEKENFRVYEGGVEQEISTFSSEDPFPLA